MSIEKKPETFFLLIFSFPNTAVPASILTKKSVFLHKLENAINALGYFLFPVFLLFFSFFSLSLKLELVSFPSTWTLLGSACQQCSILLENEKLHFPIFLRSFLNIPSVDDSMTACSSSSPSSIGSTSTAAEAAVEAGGGGGGETAAAAALERSNKDEKN